MTVQDTTTTFEEALNAYRLALMDRSDPHGFDAHLATLKAKRAVIALYRAQAARVAELEAAVEIKAGAQP